VIYYIQTKQGNRWITAEDRYGEHETLGAAEKAWSISPVPVEVRIIGVSSAWYPPVPEWREEEL
jgi:hypothetical protein